MMDTDGTETKWLSTSEILSTLSPDSSDPSFRILSFRTEPAVILVSTHLRYAWTAAPGDDTTDKGVGAFIKANHERTEEERKAVKQNEDSDDVHSKWRSTIYHQWNHVFHDVMGENGPAAGLVDPALHFHPPKHETYTVHYPLPGSSSIAIVFDSDTLLLPAYFAHSVIIRAYIDDNGTTTLAQFDETTTDKVWYVHQRVGLMLNVEGTYDKEKVSRPGKSPFEQGVAAVFVLATLCRGRGKERVEDDHLLS